MRGMASKSLPLLHRAIRVAFEAHLGQDRDGRPALPYITHPIDVMLRLRYVARITDEELLAAALLHDVIEEGDWTPEGIEREFGPRVAGLVRELTRREPSPEERRGLTKDELWELRTRLLLEEIRAMSPEAQRIKLADRLSNLEESEIARSPEKRERYRRQSRLILDAIPRESSPELWDRLDALVRSLGH